MISLYSDIRIDIINKKELVVPSSKHLHSLSMNCEAPSSGKVEKFFEYCESMSLCGNNHRGENRAVKDKL